MEHSAGGAFEHQLPREEERETVRKLIEKEGSVARRLSFFIVSFKWWQLWKAYVSYDSPDEPPGPRPGPIDNTPLLESPLEEGTVDTDAEMVNAQYFEAPVQPSLSIGNVSARDWATNVAHGSLRAGHVLRHGLMLNIDYVFVPPSAWALFKKWYGGRPDLCRPVVCVGAFQFPRLELYPLLIQVKPATGRKDAQQAIGDFGMSGVTNHDKELWFTFSRTQTLKDARVFIGQAMIHPPHQLQLFVKDADGKEAELSKDQLSKTFEEMGIADRSQLFISKEATLDRKIFSRGFNDRNDYISYTYVPLVLKNEKGSPACLGAVGLRNLGCTCYMAASLQCLSHTFPLSKFYLSGGQTAALKEFKRDILTSTFSGLLRDLWGGQYISVAPRQFKGAFSRFAPHFAGNGQQDAHEFLVLALQSLHSELVPFGQRTPTASSCCPTIEAETELQRVFDSQMIGDSSVITNTFRGNLKSTVTCRSCLTKVVNFEPFLVLSLPVPCNPLRPVNILFLSQINPPVKYSILIDKSSTVKVLRDRIKALTNCDSIALVEVYSDNAYELKDSRFLSEFRNEDTIHAHDVSGPRTVRVYYREGSMPLTAPVYVQIPKGLSNKQVYDVLRHRIEIAFRIQSADVPPFTVWETKSPRIPGTLHLNDENVGASNAESLACQWDEKASFKEHCSDKTIIPFAKGHEPNPDYAKEITCTLEDCLNSFSAEETVNWCCPTCKKFDANKQFSVQSLPDYFIVHLKRFRCDGVYREKVKTLVRIPENGVVDMSHFRNSQTPDPFELYAIVKHSGGLNSGHYSAVTRTLDGNWCTFDDSEVTELKERDAEDLASKAYVLFFKRKTDGKSDAENLWEILPDVMAASELEAERNDATDTEVTTDAKNQEDSLFNESNRIFGPVEKCNKKRARECALGDQEIATAKILSIMGSISVEEKLSPAVPVAPVSSPTIDPSPVEEGDAECPFCSRRFQSLDLVQVHIFQDHPEG